MSWSIRLVAQTNRPSNCSICLSSSLTWKCGIGVWHDYWLSCPRSIRRMTTSHDYLQVLPPVIPRTCQVNRINRSAEDKTFSTNLRGPRCGDRHRRRRWSQSPGSGLPPHLSPQGARGHPWEAANDVPSTAGLAEKREEAGSEVREILRGEPCLRGSTNHGSGKDRAQVSQSQIVN